MRRKLFILILCLFASVCHAEFFSPTPTNPENFFSIADIHFNPFAGCKSQPCELVLKLHDADYKKWDEILAQYGKQDPSGIFQDTNYILFNSTIDELKKESQKHQPLFTLILGDFLAHDFRSQYKKYANDKAMNEYQYFAKKTLQYMTYKLRSALPTNIYPAVGNNDSYSGNYNQIPRGNFFQDTVNTWSLFFNDPKQRAAFQKDFRIGGYYTVNLPGNNRLIVLNTVLFSTNARGSRVKLAAWNQINWLHEQLASAAEQHQHVWLAFHIPMGIDMYATIKNKLTVTEFWQPVFRAAMEKELNNFPGLVTEIFAGHVHKEMYAPMKVFGGIQVNLTPSISPIYGNDPSFKDYSYDMSSVGRFYYPLTLGDRAIWKED